MAENSSGNNGGLYLIVAGWSSLSGKAPTRIPADILAVT
jgi:hypothetical protein